MCHYSGDIKLPRNSIQMYKSVPTVFELDLLASGDVERVKENVCPFEVTNLMFERMLECCGAGDVANLKVLIDEFIAIVREQQVEYCGMWHEMNGNEAVWRLAMGSNSPVMLVSALDFFDALIRADLRYAHNLVGVEFHQQLFGVFKGLEVVECRASVLKCERALVEISRESRDAMFEAWQIPALAGSQYTLFETLRLLFSLAKYPMDKTRYEELAKLAEEIAASLNRSDEKTLFAFCKFMCNMSQSSWFCEAFDNDNIRRVLDIGLFGTQNPDVLCSVVYILTNIYQSRDLTDARIPQRVVQLMESYDIKPGKEQKQRSRVLFFLSQFLALLLSAFPHFIPPDARPRLGLMLLHYLQNASTMIKERLFDALYWYSSAYVEYIPMLIDNGLLACISDLLDGTRKETLRFCILLLDCILDNRPEVLQTLHDLGIVAQMSSLAETMEDSAVFLALWCGQA